MVAREKELDANRVRRGGGLNVLAIAGYRATAVPQKALTSMARSTIAG
jgi:hypothetical protein